MWDAQTLRLTVFPLPGEDLSQAPNWEGLVGKAPEVTINRGGQLAERGPVGRGVLQLAKQTPLRADLVYDTAMSPDDEPTEPPVLGPVEQELELFVPLAHLLLDRAPALQRVAFGAELLRPTGDRDEAYQYLREAIGGARFDLDGAHDFSYQINRPRESAILRGVQLNRLAKWSAIKWQRVVIASATGRQAVGPESFANRLSLDINTPAQRAEALPQDSLGNLFRELVQLGTEISQRGDIR
jgi:hypothetical protein